MCDSIKIKLKKTIKISFLIKFLIYNLYFQDGFWLATLIGAIVMIISTPTAHILSLVYKKSSSFVEDATLLSTRALVFSIN